MATRRYERRIRAETAEQTRRRILDALGADLLQRGGFDRLMEAVAHPDAREGLRGGIRGGVVMYAAHRDALRVLFSMAQLGGGL